MMQCCSQRLQIAWLKTLLNRLSATGRMKAKPLSNKHFRDNTELKHRAMAGVRGGFSQSYISWSFQYFDTESFTFGCEVHVLFDTSVGPLHAINHRWKNKGAEALSQKWLSGGTAASVTDNWWDFDPVLIKVYHQYSSAAELFASLHFSPMHVRVSTAWMWNSEWNQELSVIGDLWVLKKALPTPLPSAKAQREVRDFLILHVLSCEEGAKGLELKWHHRLYQQMSCSCTSLSVSVQIGLGNDKHQVQMTHSLPHESQKNTFYSLVLV